LTAAELDVSDEGVKPAPGDGAGGEE